MAPRPNDYHPDHRYTGVLVQDAAYMVVVPDVTPEVAALRKNPVFLYYEDNFQRPQSIPSRHRGGDRRVVERKMDALDSHVSQFYEWLPWVDGKLEVPKDPVERKRWLAASRAGEITPAIRTALKKWYGPERAAKIQHAEAFEVCEYGRQPSEDDLRKLFPMLGH